MNQDEIKKKRFQKERPMPGTDVGLYADSDSDEYVEPETTTKDYMNSLHRKRPRKTKGLRSGGNRFCNAELIVVLVFLFFLRIA